MSIDFDIIDTPCYVLDEGALRKNLHLIRGVADAADVEIVLALKAFATWGVFDIFKEYGFGAAASSLNEARLAYEELGVKAHTYAPAYKRSQIDHLFSYSSHISFNSLNQLRAYGEVAEGAGVSVGLRVNPEFSPTTYAIYNPCEPGSRFGVTEDQLRDGLPHGVHGLHFHTLFEADSYALQQVLEVFEAKFGRFLSNLKWVNMGGGHLITSKDYNREHLVEVLRSFRRRYGVKVILEPGSAFVYQTGYLVATILDIVENQGIKTAILDCSFACHMPDCLEMPYKPVILGAKDGAGYRYRMGGASCMAGDYMGDWSFDRELKIGDKIVFEDMIHYTTVKTTMFNGIDHPSLGIWEEGRGFRLIKSFDYQDYRGRLS